jgi:phospholipase/carboxylesterase
MLNILRTLAVCLLAAAISDAALGEEASTITDKVSKAAAASEAVLPPRQPESPRAIFRRSDRFAYVLEKAKAEGSPTFVLLHGSGGNEKTLIDLARKIAPNATLLGVRGRIVQDGINRWYRRLTPTSFDQADIRAEAQAFSDFLAETAHKNGIDLKRAIFLGYSNGANLIAALSMLEPGLVHKAVLLRAMPVLDLTSKPDLKALDVLTIAGKADATYSPFAPALASLLRNCGANVVTQQVALGHNIGEEDAKVVREWLTAEVAAR